MNKHIFEKYPLCLCPRKQQQRKRDHERRKGEKNIIHIRKIFRLSLFSGAFFAFVFCVVKNYVRKCVRPWAPLQITDSLPGPIVRLSIHIGRGK